MNALTGDLIWDAPVTRGFYNVAFVVEEWRDGVKIGDIIRDMQIIVVDARNDRPKLDLIPDICVEAGTLINQIVKATDKNGDKLTLTSTSGLYQSTALIRPAYATFTVPQQGAQGTLTGQFTWQTSCNQIRLEPYEVLFKVEDGAVARNTKRQPVPKTGRYHDPAYYRRLWPAASEPGRSSCYRCCRKSI